MNKREKIILTLTFAVAVYGLIDFLILSPKNKNTKKESFVADSQKITKNFVDHTMAKILKIELQIKQSDWQSLVSKIESDWEHDPFVQPLKPETQAEKPFSPSPVSHLQYSGYMSVGKLLFAVINGMEYKIGDIINEYGYQVTKITPQKVVLQKNSERTVIFLKEE